MVKEVDYIYKRYQCKFCFREHEEMSEAEDCERDCKRQAKLEYERAKQIVREYEDSLTDHETEEE